MRRLIVTITLLAVILLTFGFSAIKLLSVQSDTSTFNQTIRPKLAKYPVLRSVFGFHYDGDAEFDYLGNKNSRISIEVDTMQNLNIPKSSLDFLSRRIAAVTGKQTEYELSDIDIPSTPQVSETDLESIIATKRAISTSGNGVARIYLLVLTEDAERPTLLGSTYREDAIIVYYNAVAGLTENNPALFDNYFVSTAFHEFGHQLGLPHNTIAGCLMNESADEWDTFIQTASEVVTDFCPQEQSRLDEIKNSF